MQGTLEQRPIEIQVAGRPIQAVIRELLEKAELTGKDADIARYLVGAKLELRLQIQLPKRGANLADKLSKGSAELRPGDHEINDTTFEVALGPPDEKHVEHISEALKNPNREVWLLTRNEHVGKWQQRIERHSDIEPERVVVSSVETFVGQNLAEIGEFSSDGKFNALAQLCQIYNECWMGSVGGTPGMRIEIRP